MRRATRIALRRTVWRTLYWIVLPILFLLAFRLFWGYHAHRRLQAALARFDALHVRYRFDQFPDTSNIPPGQNAVEVLLGGLRPVSWTSADYDLIGNSLEFQTVADRAAILKWLADNHGIMEHIDATQSCSTIAWPPPEFAGDKSAVTSDFDKYGRLMLKGARIAHENHDDTQALRQLGRLSIVAYVFERSLWDVRISWALRDMSAIGVEHVCSDLALQDPAVAAEARHLIAIMLDDQSAMQGFAPSLESNTARWYAWHPSPGHPPWPWRPLAVEGLSRDMNRWGPIVVAARAPNWPQFSAACVSIPPDPRYADNNLEREILWAGDLKANWVRRDYEFGLMCLTHSRAAAILLAARIYAAKHGHLPASAAELVPDILPSIPLDFYLDPEQPLHYRLDPAGPTVWSVFENGVDDHASFKDLVYGAANPPPAPYPPTPPRPPHSAPATARRPATASGPAMTPTR